MVARCLSLFADVDVIFFFFCIFVLRLSLINNWHWINHSVLILCLEWVNGATVDAFFRPSNGATTVSITIQVKQSKLLIFVFLYHTCVCLCVHLCVIFFSLCSTSCWSYHFICGSVIMIADRGTTEWKRLSRKLKPAKKVGVFGCIS